MSQEIKIGPQLLDYSARLIKLTKSIEEATTALEKIKNDIAGSNVYKGRALEEMNAFFHYYMLNIEKLSALYHKAAQYATNTYNSHYYNEKDIINMIINLAEKG